MVHKKLKNETPEEAQWTAVAKTRLFHVSGVEFAEGSARVRNRDGLCDAGDDAHCKVKKVCSSFHKILQCNVYLF